MNYLTANLTERLSRNDPGITQVSVRRMPYIEISSHEVSAIVKALQNNDHVDSLDVSELFDDEGLLETLHSNKAITTLTVHQISSDNAWKALCRGLQENETIAEVSLGSITQLDPSELSNVACEAIRDLLATTKRLTKLTLRSFSIKEGMSAMAAGFLTNTSLRELRIQQLESEHLSLLVQSLGKIEQLTIVDCDLDFEGIDYDVHPLTKLITNSAATKLQFTECCLGNSEILALCEALKTNSSIETLDLTSNTLYASSCQMLADMLACNTTLRHLILEENIVGDAGVERLSQGLAQNTTLHRLNLKANYIGSDGCMRLAGALSGVSALRQLDLSENDIADAGAGALGELLKTNNHLRCLVLSSCSISDDGIASLCCGLSTNTILRELSVNNNCCKETGATAASDMLAVNETLHSLDLSSCQITDSTLQSLLASLKSGVNTTLRSLYLSFNAFGNAGAKHIADIIRKGRHLTNLSIQFNAFDSTGLSNIVSALKENTHLRHFFFWNGCKSIETDGKLRVDMEHLLALNQAGRRAVTECKTNKCLWPRILERAGAIYGPTALFYFLRELPELVEDAHERTHP